MTETIGENKQNLESEENKIDLSLYDISHVPFLIENIILDYCISNPSLLPSEQLKKTSTIYEKLQDSLNKKGMSFDKILKLSISDIGILSLEPHTGQVMRFDLESQDEDLFIGDKDDKQLEREQDYLHTTQALEAINPLLIYMESIFEKNGSWFNSDHLGDKDVLDNQEAGELNGNNLKDLQKLLQKQLLILEDIPLKHMSQEQEEEYLAIQKAYLQMFMGVGDKYEGGARYLIEDTKRFVSIIDNIVSAGDLSSALDYLYTIHAKIDANNYQSTTVENSYRVLTEQLHKKILERIISSESSEQDIVNFAKIITGKYELKNQEGLNPSANYTRVNNIDDRYRDPGTANDAILYLMNRKNGIIDRMDRSGAIILEQPEISEQNPKSIVNLLEKEFYERYGNELKTQNIFYKILQSSGYSDLLSLDIGQSYDHLDFTQKTKLAVLHRVMQRIEDGKTIWKKTKEISVGALDNSYKKISGSDAERSEIDLDMEYHLQDFAGLFNDVAKDYRDELVGSIDESISSDIPFGNGFGFGKSAQDLGLEGDMAVAYNLFKDINGIGFFDMSDESIAKMKTGGKFAGVIAIGIAVPFLIIPSSGLLMQGAAAGAAATFASMAINPHGYDTFGEAAKDVTTDLLVGTSTGFAGGVMAKGIGHEGAKFLSKGGAINTSVFATDLTFLGLVPEAGRQMWMNDTYHKEVFLK